MREKQIKKNNKKYTNSQYLRKKKAFIFNKCTHLKEYIKFCTIKIDKMKYHNFIDKKLLPTIITFEKTSSPKHYFFNLQNRYYLCL